MDRRRIVSVVVLAVLAGQLMVPQLDPPAAAVTTPSPVASSAAEAVALARRTGTSVEVASARTERETRFANPDGTWTLEQHTSPVRVRGADGGWSAVDTTLARHADAVRPKAAVMDIRFSPGGSGPLVTIAKGSQRLSLTLPWSLPKPTLDGPRATYHDVLPETDLVLTALAEGFSEVLVVRSRQAAANPALRELRLRIEASGLTVRGEAGGFVAVDGAGVTVFTSPAPMMWDSSGGKARDLDWPADGDRRTRVATSVTAAEILLVPDRAMLDDPATVFPVYIDPAVNGSRNEWAMISSGYSDQEYYKFSGDEGMGLCDVQTDGTCSRDQVKRLIWEFGVSRAVHGSRVLGAKFRAWETHAWDCTADAVQLWLVGGISSSTNWNNHAGTWSRQLDSETVARKSGCSLGPGWVEFNAISAATEFASKRWSSLTLGLRAGNEGSMTGGWKRFRNDAQLSVTYNSPPRVPTNLSADGAGCVSGTGRPVISSTTPTLRAVVSDPDSDETDLRAAFAWERWDGAAWVALGSGTQANLRTAAPGQVRINSGLTHAGLYRWHVHTQDPYSFEGASGTDSSGWSAWCEFEVDIVGPAVAPGVSSPVYGTDLNVTYGAVGLTADFTFTASGVADVSGYKWGWSTPVSTLVNNSALGAPVTLALTPPPPQPTDPTDSGLVTLYVASVDRSGRTSPLKEYVFKVGAATAPVGIWEMNEPAGATTLADTNQRTTQHPATLVNATAGRPGMILSGPAAPGSTAVTFNGSTSTATTSAPVVNTGKSFSVSAWVRLNSNTAVYQTAVGQAGNNTSAFFLQYNQGDWAFAVHESDVSSGVVATKASSRAWAEHRWTHLVGVYDGQGRQMRLYVNGELTSTATRATPWNGARFLTIGHVRVGATISNPWNGDIAHVKVWDRVLSTPEIEPMTSTLVGRWRLDGNGEDSTPYGRALTAGAGTAVWTEDQRGQTDGALAVPTGPMWLSTTGPAVRTDQSFTVMAWVRTSDTNNYQTIACQFGATRCAFYLQYSLPHDRWGIVLPEADGHSEVYHAATSDAPPTYDEWVHLTAVFDGTAGMLRFYVNGVQEGSKVAVGSWHGNGGFRIGVQDSGALHGAIDEVRLYAGVVTPDQVASLCGC
ncbi:LamG domain-containing protein [Allorhizocola rhizosphaerae]|uniref:LamG domain-containing protein n=1 Tax=Allorhizocola rhizosphaerae TaxID=1872709 RepID=UPI000E3D905E|nr:LamG domain-containing protein [Allorhizocola rhizosphaerae]